MWRHEWPLLCVPRHIIKPNRTKTCIRPPAGRLQRGSLTRRRGAVIAAKPRPGSCSDPVSWLSQDYFSWLELLLIVHIPRLIAITSSDPSASMVHGTHYCTGTSYQGTSNCGIVIYYGSIVRASTTRKGENEALSTMVHVANGTSHQVRIHPTCDTVAASRNRPTDQQKGSRPRSRSRSRSRSPVFSFQRLHHCCRPYSLGLCIGSI